MSGNFGELYKECDRRVDIGDRRWMRLPPTAEIGLWVPEWFWKYFVWFCSTERALSRISEHLTCTFIEQIIYQIFLVITYDDDSSNFMLDWWPLSTWLAVRIPRENLTTRCSIRIFRQLVDSLSDFRSPVVGCKLGARCECQDRALFRFVSTWLIMNGVSNFLTLNIVSSTYSLAHLWRLPCPVPLGWK